MKNSQRIVGLQPLYPPPLANSPWWTMPVRAERWAAFRIAIGLAVFVDIVQTYWPVRRAIFGAGSLGDPSVFASRSALPLWNWSLLEGVTNPLILDAALMAWAASALCLAAGFWSRRAALVGWMMSVSVLNTNYFLHNGGDRLRTMALLLLAVTPCAAAWSWQARRACADGDSRPVLMAPWPIRLLLLQLVVIYFFSGLLKEKGTTWQSGEALWLVMTNAAWTRWSYAQFPVWPLLARGLTWFTLAWELTFPLLLLHRRTRVPALLIGASFHVATGLLLKLGMFPVYALCMYAPLLPWEKLADRRGTRAHGAESTADETDANRPVEESPVLACAN